MACLLRLLSLNVRKKRLFVIELREPSDIRHQDDFLATDKSLCICGSGVVRRPHKASRAVVRGYFCFCVPAPYSVPEAHAARFPAATLASSARVGSEHRPSLQTPKNDLGAGIPR